LSQNTDLTITLDNVIYPIFVSIFD